MTVLSLLIQQTYFIVSNMSSLGHNHVGSLFTYEDKKEKEKGCLMTPQILRPSARKYATM